MNVDGCKDSIELQRRCMHTIAKFACDLLEQDATSIISHMIEMPEERTPKLERPYSCS